MQPVVRVYGGDVKSIIEQEYIPNYLEEEIQTFWFVENDGSQLYKDTVIQYLNDKFCGVNGLVGSLPYYGCTNHSAKAEYSKKGFGAGFTELSLNEFITKILKQDMKEIKYYKIKSGYEKFVKSLINSTASIYDLKNVRFYTTCDAYPVIVEAGVLDLWFEAVHKEVVSVGGKFDVTIDGDKIYHNMDDITTFVKDMIQKNNAIEAIYGNNYKVGFKDIIFSFTGCQKVETKLSDWKKVLDVYNTLQK